MAVIIGTQVIMDVHAENDLDSIKKEAIRAYFAGEGDQEEGFEFLSKVIVYPWLEEGQPVMEGSAYPKPTFIQVTPDDVDNAMSLGEDSDGNTVINFPMAEGHFSEMSGEAGEGAKVVNLFNERDFLKD